MWRPASKAGLAVLCALVLDTTALAQSAPGSPPSAQGATDPGQAVMGDAPAETRPVDAKGFVDQARAFNKFAIDSGMLAEKRAKSPAVRQLATKLVEDHVRLDDKLGRIVVEGSVDKTARLPDADPIADPRGLLASLRDSDPGTFDLIFLQVQADAVGEAMTLFTSFSQTADNAALRDFAMATLPILQEHQLTIAELQQ